MKIQGPNQGPKEAKTRHSRSKRTERDSGHHGLPVVGRTVRGGGTHGRAPWTHDRASR